MKKCTFLFLVLIALNSFSQAKLLATLPCDGINYGYCYTPSVYGFQTTSNNLFVYASNGTWAINLNNKNKTRVDTNGIYKKIYLNNNGAFYIPNNNNDIPICFVPDTGNPFLSNKIGTTPFGSTQIIFNNRFYVVASFNNQSCLWESDGTSAGTQQLFSSSQTIVGLTSLGNTLFFATKNQTSFSLYSYQYGGTPISYFSLAHDSISNNTLTAFGNDSTNIYFSLVDTLGKPALWKTNLTATGTKKFMNNAQLNNYNSIFFRDSSFFLYNSNNQFDISLSKGYLSNPDSIWPAPFIKSNNYTFQTHTQPAYTLQYQKQITQNFNNNMFVSSSAQYGYELTKLNASDSMEVIDLAKGPSSSLYKNGKIYCNYNNKLYVLASNQNNTEYYLYASNGNTLTSLFQINNVNNVVAIYADSANFYWAAKNGTQIDIFSRSLSDINPAQPATPVLNTEWERQVALYNFSPNNGSNTYPLAANFDAGGNVITCAGLWSGSTDMRSEYSLLFSGIDSAHYLNGGCLVTKYNTYGQLQWYKTIGSVGGYQNQNGMLAANIDNSGNPIVVGSFWRIGYFDADSLTDPNTGIYLAKLNNNSGNIAWKKKIGSSHYNIGPNDWIDGVICDKNNNIYVSFTRDDNYPIIYGVTPLQTPTRLLLKYDSLGNLIFGKSFVTPFGGTGGTFEFRYDAENNRLIHVAAGNYTNPNNCFNPVGNVVSTFDTDGNLLEQYSFLAQNYVLLGPTLNANGKLFSAGVYGGYNKTDIFLINTPIDNSNYTYCPGIGSVDILINNGKPEHVFNDSLRNFSPLAAKADNDYIYVLGTEKDANGNLLIKRYDKNGILKGRRILTIPYYNGAISTPLCFDVSNTHFLLMLNSSSTTTDSLPDPISYSPYEESVASTFKFLKNIGWETDNQPETGISINNDVLLYPNPTTGEFTVAFTNISDYSKLEIYNLLGQKLVTQTLQDNWKYIFNFSFLPDGAYIIRFSGNLSYSQKLIMRH